MWEISRPITVPPDIYQPPATAIVPNVVHDQLSPAQAKARIQAAGFKYQRGGGPGPGQLPALRRGPEPAGRDARDSGICRDRDDRRPAPWAALLDPGRQSAPITSVSRGSAAGMVPAAPGSGPGQESGRVPAPRGAVRAGARRRARGDHRSSGCPPPPVAASRPAPPGRPAASSPPASWRTCGAWMSRCASRRRSSLPRSARRAPA